MRNEVKSTSGGEKPLCLVTGACGFMGSQMVEVLHEAGYPIRATDLKSAYAEDNRKTGRFPGVLKKLGVEFIPSDLTQPETLKPLIKDVDYVFHIAAIFNYSTPLEILRKVNVDGTRHLFELLLAEGRVKRVVLWGAGGVYGLPSNMVNIPLREDMAPLPPNNYLRSKWEEEFLTIELGRTRGLPFTIIRPTTVYGPRGVYGGGQLIMSAATMKVSMMPSNFTARIPFVHVRDVCAAALFLAEKSEAAGEVFNLNDDSQLTNIEYFQYVAKVTGHKFAKLPPVPLGFLKRVLSAVASMLQWISRNITHKPPLLEKDSASFIGEDFTYSNEKLKKIGYRFKYPDARQGLKDTIKWYIEAGWIKSSLPGEKMRYAYEGLAKADQKTVEAVFQNGLTPDTDSLVGWEFDGYNLTPLADILGIRKFRKGFYKKNGMVKGYNVKMEQNKFEEPWEYKDGKPQRFGWYDVIPLAKVDETLPSGPSLSRLKNTYPHPVLLHYGVDERNTLFQGKMLRDLLVQVNKDDKDIYLGKAYNAVGKRLLFPSFFILRRASKTDFQG